MGAKPAITSTREAMRILDKDRSTVIKWARQGRMKIVYESPGIIMLDYKSVLALADELAEETIRRGEKAC